MKNGAGAELTESEEALVECYRTLVRVIKESQDLAPFERRNALKAVAALWQVANGLDMDPGQLYDIGA
jgi:molybdenum-dependent DNA-binding transcriptional regulator ModE